MFPTHSSTLPLGLFVLFLGRATLLAAAPTAEQIEFFERRVRPVLAEACYRCHSSKAEKIKGGLVLDTFEGLSKGGDAGPVLRPGLPEQSRLIQAVRYTDPDLQMPPKGKLADEQVEALVQWVSMGAPWPSAAATQPAPANEGFDFQARRQRHWAWQPIRRSPLPPVQNLAWVSNPVDRFILARLETNGLAPAPRAESATLLRRLSFDLTGLPPAPSLTAAAHGPKTPAQYAAEVDRLLASPRFGERWARHWLDLVRYAETLGHEFDYANPNAWRYRDYVIRAFNVDLPYDLFVREQIAGDLLPAPRRHPVDGSNESVIGTAFYWLGQRDHSPVDVRQHQAELIDNQIDVLSKTFLGITVACARCHDHKFDAIPTQDYYSLYGILSSSRYTQAALDAPAPLARQIRQLQTLKRAFRQQVGRVWAEQIPQAAARVAAEGIELREPEAVAPSAPLHWQFEESAFQDPSPPAGEFSVDEWRDATEPILEAPTVHSGLLSRRLEGAARSETFTITNRFIHLLAAGRNARINIPVDNFTMIRDPIYGGLKRILNDDRFRWLTIDVGMWHGHRAFIELNDMSVADPGDDARAGGFGPDGYIALQRVWFSNEPKPPAAEVLLPSTTPVSSSGTNATNRCPQCEARIAAAVDAWRSGDQPRLQPAQAALLNSLIRRGFLDAGKDPEVRRLTAQYAELDAAIPVPKRVPAMTDGTGLDEPVFIRGNHRLAGPLAPRRFLQALAGSDQPPVADGSGRRELADRMLAPSDPLLSRVIVNRVWLHLFGRGLVPTPDDFGELGQPPSHPELLDWLADWFRTEGEWSIKGLIRLLVTSSTYQMSSHPSRPDAEQADPDDKLWHRMPLRRLEGEAIRDAILAMSGRLDARMFDFPVPVYLTEFMEGRGRPAKSGPMDGAGRRSIYLEVRRNFVAPMMRVFDMPVPFTTIGRRTVSNVPAQSLYLMNDPFVLGEAERWARRILATPGGGIEDHVQQMYRAAFNREAARDEIVQAVQFLRQQAAAYGAEPDSGLREPRVWADLGHVLFNVKEFVFLN